MAYAIDLLTFSNHAGHLSVLERVIHGNIETALFRQGEQLLSRSGQPYESPGEEVLICLAGHCHLQVQPPGGMPEEYLLSKPSRGVILIAGETCILTHASPDCLLLLLSAQHYPQLAAQDARSHRPETT